MAMIILSKPLLVVSISFFFLALSHGFVMTPRTLRNRFYQNTSSNYLTTKELWFDQTLNHYSFDFDSFFGFVKEDNFWVLFSLFSSDSKFQTFISFNSKFQSFIKDILNQGYHGIDAGNINLNKNGLSINLQILVSGVFHQSYQHLVKSNLFCVCGDMCNSAELIQVGVYRCVLPQHSPGLVNLYMSLDGHKQCDQVLSFDYRAPLSHEPLVRVED